ncbi:MAG TPA: hypothetical protein DEV73_01550 [Candidatus Zambryskibacteria bacterium]|nr:hypothetical protein [Candidatus Zambryskibacteria bacterium]
MKKLLAPGGQLFITVPTSFNEFLHKLIMTHKMPFTNEYYLQRISYLNDWKQVQFTEIQLCDGYDSHYANANCLYIGQFFKK